ncbi:MAG: M36 family metallopeptidase [Candidatus Paceibacterota bacterium]
MGRELDRRDSTVSRLTPERENRLRGLAEEASNQLPGSHRLNIAGFDPVTGNARSIVSESAPAEKGNYVQRALDHVRGISRALGFEATQPSEFAADPHPQETSSGSVTVHLQQQYKGISIYQAAEAVRFSPAGALEETIGSTVSIPEDLDVEPRLRVQDAVVKAAQHVAVPGEDEQGATDQFGEPLPMKAVDLTDFEPIIIASFPDKADQPAVLENGPFEEKIRANLIWFPMGAQLRLGWETVITMPDFEGQYRTIVDAETGEILFCRQLIETMIARGNVYLVDGSTSRQTVPFPRSLSDYELPVPGNIPSGFPDDWVSDSRSSGNSTFAHLGDTGPTIQGDSQSGVLTFDPNDPTGDDQKVLNIFYYNCYMHDFFYLLGFREADGNFQLDNLGRGGQRRDPVDARAHSGTVWGTANMRTPADGSRPVMNMGLVASSNRHTAFDSSVVFHEFMHGVTNRLVGGPLNVRALEQPQSGGMGEGWGDYIACTINDSDVVGAWAMNRPLGFREFRYDSNFPDHFGKLGTGRYNQVHNIGEIWCATLMEMNRKIGKVLAVQLVVDALKLSPANPGFLDMRDAILKALDNKLAAGQLTAGEHAEARRGSWATFAKFGMGPDSRSNGANLSGIVADFNTPPDNDRPSVRVEASPNIAIPDNQPSGVTDTLTFSQPGKITRISVAVDIPHTYIGDLRMTLTSPTGESMTLHNRSGGNANNLVKTYTSEGTSDLAALVGQHAQGSWTLHVADLAGRDTGTLRAWTLEIGLEAAAGTARGEATPALLIGDNDSGGVSSMIGITSAGAVREIEVSVDITHTYIGDLNVELTAPSGQRVMLHSRQSGSQDNLIRTYNAGTLPALATLVGQSVQGNWTLRVSDHAAIDVGKLNRWSLEAKLDR